jgi:hypothetical protein
MSKSLFARCFAFVMLIAAGAACSPTTPPPPVPTLIELPTLPPPTVPVTEVVAAPSPSPADLVTEEVDTPTPPPSETPIPTATFTPSLTPLLPNTATDTFTPSATFTFTPSLTITNTATPTETPNIGLLGELARLGEQATILPIEQRIPAPTLTALAIAALSLQPTQAPIPGVLPPIGASPTPVIAAACLYPPPAAVAAVLASDPALQNQLGCAVGAPPVTQLVSTAAQFFERGAMFYVSGTPGAIYALFSDGRFRRYDDTFVSGVDPDRGGETPPAGLVEPIRGFGKVWRLNPEVRGLLGWARGSEMGNTSSLQVFSNGRVIYLPQLSESVVLIEDLGGYSGTWRVLAGAF